MQVQYIPLLFPPPMPTYRTAQVAAAASRMTGGGQAERFQMRIFQRAGKASGFCDVAQTDMALELETSIGLNLQGGGGVRTGNVEALAQPAFC